MSRHVDGEKARQEHPAGTLWAKHTSSDPPLPTASMREYLRPRRNCVQPLWALEMLKNISQSKLLWCKKSFVQWISWTNVLVLKNNLILGMHPPRHCSRLHPFWRSSGPAKNSNAPSEVQGPRWWVEKMSWTLQRHHLLCWGWKGAHQLSTGLLFPWSYPPGKSSWS